jgi:putative membrane protein
MSGGFLMGVADLIPGVSGGTIALVLGIYERLVASIREGSSALGSILRGDFDGFKTHLRRVEWLFLLPLLAGILLAVITLASLLESQLEERPTLMAAAFLGLVAGSVLVAWRLIRVPAARHLVWAALVGVALFVLLGLGQETTVRDPSILAFFGSGALAICAMILPGISGSLILLLIGMYPAVIGALNDRRLVSIGVFVLGALIGLALFSQVLYWALSRHHDDVLAMLIGLMAGSFRVLWPWPDGVDSAGLDLPGDDWLPALTAALIGFAVVFLIARLADDDERISELQPSP